MTSPMRQPQPNGYRPERSPVMSRTPQAGCTGGPCDRERAKSRWKLCVAAPSAHHGCRRVGASWWGVRARPGNRVTRKGRKAEPHAGQWTPPATAWSSCQVLRQLRTGSSNFPPYWDSVGMRCLQVWGRKPLPRGAIREVGDVAESDDGSGKRRAKPDAVAGRRPGP